MSLLGGIRGMQKFEDRIRGDLANIPHRKQLVTCCGGKDLPSAERLGKILGRFLSDTLDAKAVKHLVERPASGASDGGHQVANGLLPEALLLSKTC